MDKLKKFMRDNPEYRREILEMIYMGEDPADILVYFTNRRLEALNDKILSRMGI